jgi:hypothetical protein
MMQLMSAEDVKAALLTGANVQYGGRAVRKSAEAGLWVIQVGGRIAHVSDVDEAIEIASDYDRAAAFVTQNGYDL